MKERKLAKRLAELWGHKRFCTERKRWSRKPLGALLLVIPLLALSACGHSDVAKEPLLQTDIAPTAAEAEPANSDAPMEPMPSESDSSASTVAEPTDATPEPKSTQAVPHATTLAKSNPAPTEPPASEPTAQPTQPPTEAPATAPTEIPIEPPTEYSWWDTEQAVAEVCAQANAYITSIGCVADPSAACWVAPQYTHWEGSSAAWLLHQLTDFIDYYQQIGKTNLYVTYEADPDGGYVVYLKYVL